MTSRPDAQSWFDAMMRLQVSSALRELGFRGTPRLYRLTSGKHAGSIRLQKSRHSRREHVEFTFHVSAPCMGSEVIVYLMPERDPPVPYWWALAAGEPSGPVADSVISAIRGYALPAILAGLDDADHERDAGEEQSGPAIPPLVNPAYDGFGADPTSWYLQPTGVAADTAFANLASEGSSQRFGAAETIARLVQTDPRAVPALIDRLNADLSPYVRRMVASRMLAPLARREPVRDALEIAAAADPDCQVRWAARYALRQGEG